MTIIFAISFVMSLVFWILNVIIEIDYFYLPVAISLVGLLSLINFRSLYKRRAKALIEKSKEMNNVYSIESEEKEFLLSTAPVILPRFYAGSQMPANAHALLILGNFLLVPIALFYEYYVVAALSALVLVFLLRFFSFFSRYEKNNIRMACIQYLKATGRNTFSDFDMQYAEMLYGQVIDLVEAVTMNISTEKENI